MLIYWSSSPFRMGDALPGPGHSPMGLHPAGRAVVTKEIFLQGLQPAGRAVVPFSLCWLVCLCHLIKTAKMANKLEKALTFQREKNILHHYKGILLLKQLWQNQNYQFVLCGSQDWSLDGFAVSGSDPDPSGSTDPHPNLVNSYGFSKSNVPYHCPMTLK